MIAQEISIQWVNKLLSWEFDSFNTQSDPSKAATLVSQWNHTHTMKPYSLDTMMKVTDRVYPTWKKQLPEVGVLSAVNVQNNGRKALMKN